MRRNLKSIERQLAEISGKDTNAIVRNEIPNQCIGSLTRQINELLKKYRGIVLENNRLVKNFRVNITNLAHDLRTPLTTSAGYIEMIKEGNLTKEEEAEYIGIIEERQELVKKLLDQLFYYARIESGELHWEEAPVNLTKSLSSVLALYYNDFTSIHKEPEVNMLEERLFVLGDEDAIRRVFTNIINNGLYHGEGDYQVELCREEKPVLGEGVPTIRFVFSNRSQPYEQMELPKIFEQFYTKTKKSTSYGTGLGMAIAKELVERMHGKIEASYEDGRFSVIVWLPEDIK